MFLCNKLNYKILERFVNIKIFSPYKFQQHHPVCSINTNVKTSGISLKNIISETIGPIAKIVANLTSAR